MARCARCELPYPPGFTGPVWGSHNYSGQHVCGLCAVDISNELHGQRQRNFKMGITAQSLAQMARGWREKNPHQIPKPNPKRAVWLNVPKVQ